MIWYGVWALVAWAVFLVLDHLLWLRWRRRWLKKAADSLVVALQDDISRDLTKGGVRSLVVIDYGDTP